jgi:hypothetical protein
MAITLPSRLAARQVPSCRWPHKAKRSLSVMRSIPTMATGDEDHWQDRSHATPPMPPNACCGAYGVPPSSVLDYTRIPSIRVALHETVVQCTRKGNGGPAILLLAHPPAEPGGRAWTPQPSAAPIWSARREDKNFKWHFHPAAPAARARRWRLPQHAAARRS